MKEKDSLLNDFLSEKIKEQTTMKIIGGQPDRPIEWTQPCDAPYGGQGSTNDSHTAGDIGNCDNDTCTATFEDLGMNEIDELP